MSDIAKIVRSDGVQAVQLPPELRFDGDTVQIRRDGEAVILEPITDERVRLQSRVHPFDAGVVAAMDAEWSSFPRLPDDLADEILAAVEEETPQQERPELDALFK
ncbi:antitoxin [uncultured Methylobacterium sp.]|uniref:antitoxin n=1 Tax=uncultured Methylobacterium sp. TaxID=157278 RepID=UPI0035C971E6